MALQRLLLCWLALAAVCAPCCWAERYPGLRETTSANLTASQFFHKYDGVDNLEKLEASYTSKNFYVDTGNSANIFANYGMDIYMRTPCSFSSPHYHAYGTEVSLSIGPDASQYVLMFSEDMERILFYHLPPYSSVAIPAGWLHSIINTCGRVRTVAAFGVFDQGNTLVPFSPLKVNSSAVELTGATKEEFERIFSWVQGGEETLIVPRSQAPRHRNLAPACLEWCKQNGPASAAPAAGAKAPAVAAKAPAAAAKAPGSAKLTLAQKLLGGRR